MSFFSKKKNDDFFIFSDDESSGFGAFAEDGQPHGNGAVTPEEISELQSRFKQEHDTATGALESLIKKMNEMSEDKSASEKPKTDNAPQQTSPGTNKANAEKPEPDGAQYASAAVFSAPASSSPDTHNSAQSEANRAFRQAERSAGSENGKDTPEKTASAEGKKTLLEKCRPFILDGEGDDSAMHAAPTYKLESVAEILKSESLKTLDKLSQKYDISFDDLGKYGFSDNPAKAEPQKPADKAAKPVSKPVKEEKVAPKREPEVYEDIISSVSGNATSNKNVFHVISDIDTSDSQPETPETPDMSHTATIKFTPVADSDSTSRISVSSQTRPLDLTGELAELTDDGTEAHESELKLEQTEFDEYEPKEEFRSEKEAKHFLRMLSVKKRSHFLRAFFSVLFTLLLACSKLPFLSETILAHTRTADIICTAVLAIIILINADMFGSVARIISRRSSPEICAVTASLSVLAYAVAAAYASEPAMDMLLLCGIILSFRSVCVFLAASGRLLSFRQIAGNTPKRAVKLIDDRAVTFAMAKNSIEGDVLAAAPQRTAHIDGFMKYSTFRVVLAGKLPAVTLVSLVLSLAVGFAGASYFDGAVYGFYAAAAVQCFAAMPVLFFIDSLPFASAAKRLSRCGAMIAGKVGAEHIEYANAVVFSSEDIFPSGTVTLHNMQLLSDNSIDDTIIRAASLTDALNSPLAPIFKKIAGTDKNVVLPDSDTVKYEDRMGISGWVDDRLLFIGNRTLMEAHGIECPSVEVDRKILRQGFFPVYVAAEDKAYALLTVHYTVRPDISRELRRVSALGVTMLINSSDPNMTEEMICDYMGLYEDSVKVMSAAGCHMYKNAVTYTPRCQAPAAYKGSPVGLASIISSASRIKKSNILLTVLYTLTSVIGAILFAYMSFNSSGSLLSGAFVLLYCLISTVVSYILYLTQKP